MYNPPINGRRRWRELQVAAKSWSCQEKIISQKMGISCRLVFKGWKKHENLIRKWRTVVLVGQNFYVRSLCPDVWIRRVSQFTPAEQDGTLGRFGGFRVPLVDGMRSLFVSRNHGPCRVPEQFDPLAKFVSRRWRHQVRVSVSIVALISRQQIATYVSEWWNMGQSVAWMW